jgi:hypothetical protein
MLSIYFTLWGSQSCICLKSTGILFHLMRKPTQMMGARITAEEQDDAEQRANTWIAAHPLKKASE